jgi:hypothetical protein
MIASSNAKIYIVIVIFAGMRGTNIPVGNFIKILLYASNETKAAFLNPDTTFCF